MTMATLTEQQLDAVTNAAYEADADLRSYSGRAMFGQRCVALAIDSTKNLTAFFIHLTLRDHDLATLMSREIRMDQLGLGEIAYWPSLTADLDDDDDDEDEDF